MIRQAGVEGTGSYGTGLSRHLASEGVEVIEVNRPDRDDAPLRLVTAVLFELHDEWIAFPRRYLPEGSMDLYPAELPESSPALPGTTNTPYT